MRLAYGAAGSGISGSPRKCSLVLAQLLPCKDYLLGGADDVPAACCQGATQLVMMIRQPEQKSVCECLKKAAQDLHVNAARAKMLPEICHINVPDFDCNGFSSVEDFAA